MARYPRFVVVKTAPNEGVLFRNGVRLFGVTGTSTGWVEGIDGACIPASECAELWPLPGETMEGTYARVAFLLGRVGAGRRTGLDVASVKQRLRTVRAA